MGNGLYTQGQWHQGHGDIIEKHNPANGALVFSAQSADEAQVRQAVENARAAFPAFSRLDRQTRIGLIDAYGAALNKRKEALAEAICTDTGKPKWEGLAEAGAMIGKIAISIDAYQKRTGESQSAAAFGHMALSHKAYGVMAVLGPFNFPGHLPNGHMVPALLAGNTVVFKPSELAPNVSLLMVEAFEEAGFGPNIINLVMGARDTGAALLNARGIDGVLFTGSAQTGTMIHKMFGGRPEVVLALEMGGNNPLIIWPDVDVEAAADQFVHSAFITTGQRCSCARRVILPKGDFGDAVLAAVSAHIDAMIIGPPNGDPAPFIGPLIHARQAEMMMAAQAQWMAQGGKAIKLASILSDLGPAYVRPGMVDMSGVTAPEDHEIFAPLAQIYRVDNFDEAINLANNTVFGLSAGLISDDAELANRALGEMRAGLININRPTTGAASSLPFGGPGLSGNGRPSAYYAADYAAFPVASQCAPIAERLDAIGLPQTVKP